MNKRKSPSDGFSAAKTAMKKARSDIPIHSRRLLVQASLSWLSSKGEARSAQAKLLVDSGATGPIMSRRFVLDNKLPRSERETPIPISNANGEQIPGAGRYIVPNLGMAIANHREKMAWEVGPIEAGIDGYLPVSWLSHHNPDIDWTLKTIQWRSEYCETFCLPKEIGSELPSLIQLVEESESPEYRQSEGQLCAAWTEPDDVPMIPWHDADGGNVLNRLPDYLHDLGSVFSEEESSKLPDHSSYDHEIKLMPGTQPPYGPLYAMNERELAALKEYLTEAEAAGKIRRSNSPAGAPVIFVPKPNGKLRLCVDYRGLNAVTVKNRYPLPLMSELMEKLAGAKIFTKIDLKNGYNLIRMKPGEEWKTAFRTRYGLYEYLVMPFGLCNAPASFQAMMNEIFSDLLDVGVIVYIDDILIYSKTEEEHKKLVRTVVERLKAHGLCGSIDKSCFHVNEVDFLGFVVKVDGIGMNQKKIEEILNWKSPECTKHVQKFLGFTNFYRRFILKYSDICRPLTDLTKKEVPFVWSEECEAAFQELKHRFTSGPILVHFHSDRKTIVETDASDFALGCVLSQLQDDKTTRPVAFHSWKFNSAELNYDVHDKEMLAIVVAFKEWEHMLKSVRD